MTTSTKLKPRAVIFDLGCTLIEYETIPWEEQAKKCALSAKAYLIESGFSIPDQIDFIALYEEVKADYRKIASESLIEWSIPQASQKLLTRLGIKAENGLVDRLFDAYYQPTAAQLYVFDDAFETLSQLRRKVEVIGLISNTIFPERAHLAELERFQLASFFDFTIFSSTFGWRKPHPDIFRQAAKLSGLEPKECVYIGDRYVEDVWGPAQIGMPTILKFVPRREYPADMPTGLRQINKLSDVWEHIEF